MQIFAIFSTIAILFANQVNCNKIVKCKDKPTLFGAKLYKGSAIVGALRKFECLPGFKLSGKNSFVCTEDGEWKFGGSCIKKIECAGAKPEAKCKRGESVDFYSTTCGEDGTWIMEFNCSKNCGQLPDVAFGEIDDGESSLGSRRHIQCFEGYQLESVDYFIVCGRGGVWSAPSKCVPIVTSKAVFESVDTIRQEMPKKIDCGAKPELTCDKGWSATFISAKCNDDGTWATQLVCGKDCGAVPNLPSAKIEDGSFASGSRRRVTCAEGYRLLDVRGFITCGEDGTWSKVPCEKIELFQTTETPPTESMGESSFKSDRQDFPEDSSAKNIVFPCDLEKPESGGYFNSKEMCDGISQCANGNDEVGCDEVSSVDYYDDITSLDDLAEEFGDEDAEYESPIQNKPVGNISCYGEKSQYKDNRIRGHFYWPSDRCNGFYDCDNGADEAGCPNKCSGFRYPDVADDIADCRAYMPRLYYDFETNQCKNFIYGGCAEVPNMFLTKKECETECVNDIITAPRSEDSGSGDIEASMDRIGIRSGGITLPCAFEEDVTEATEYYSAEARCDGVKNCKNGHDEFECPAGDTTEEPFIYDDLKDVLILDGSEGSEGNISCYPLNPNNNDFYYPKDRCDGKYTCPNGADEARCPWKCFGAKYPSIEDKIVDCKAEIPMFYFDIDTGLCHRFIYGGCADVLNRFETEEECLRECADIASASGSGADFGSVEQRVEELSYIRCNKDDKEPQFFKPSEHCDGVKDCENGFDETDCSVALEDLVEKEDREDFLMVDELDDDDWIEERPRDAISCDPSKPNSMEFYLPKDRCDGAYSCESRLDELNCPEKCLGRKYPSVKDSDDCNGEFPMFYYDIDTGKCVRFIYGGCAEEINLFMTEEECLHECDGITKRQEKPKRKE